MDVTRQAMDKTRIEELRLYSQYERQVALAVIRHAPPPKVVRARWPVIRKRAAPVVNQKGG